MSYPDPFPPPQAPASSRPQQARALVRSRLVNIQHGPVCSCHPAGGHPAPPSDIATRDTQKIRRRR